MDMIITSEKNQTVKWLESLQIKKFRQEHQVFLAEGERLVKDGMHYLEPKLIVLSESYADACHTDFAAETLVVSDSIFKKIAQTVSPQGIAAVFPIQHKRTEDLPKGEPILLLNKIMDPGNLGTMIRTAEAAGFFHIVLDKGCVDPYNPKVVRSTMSSLFRLHLYQAETLCDVIEALQPDYRVYAAAYDESAVSLFEADFPRASAIMIGNEANGIETHLLQKADQIVYIPMQGNIESLNAAVSAAVLMYEHHRQMLN